MDVKLNVKIMLCYSRGVKSQQDFTTGIGFYVYNVSGFSIRLDIRMVYCEVINVSRFYSSNPYLDWFLGRENMICFSILIY